MKRAAVVAIGAELIMAGSFLLMPFVHHGITHSTLSVRDYEVSLTSLRHDCTEDMNCWDCIAMGDRTCGPSNYNGYVAGCYDDHRMLVALWPCAVVVNPDGSSDVYVP